MKSKITPPALLLLVTGTLFIAGIFFAGIQAKQQIQKTDQNLDTFISQVEARQQELDDAQTSFSSAIKAKQDLLNYQQKKSSGNSPVVPEHRDISVSDGPAAVSVFSQDHD